MYVTVPSMKSCINMNEMQPPARGSDGFLYVDISSLESPSRLLRPIDDKIVSELMRSIQSNGLLQPIVIRRCGTKYEIVFGNHRLKACRRLGLSSVPALVTDFSEDEAFLARVSENLVRNSYIDPIEEAEGYRMLLAKGWTINAIGQRVGKSDSYICERLALLDRLARNLRSRLTRKDSRLTSSHAELLSRIPDFGKQNDVAELVERKRLSVRSLEDLLNDAPAPAKVRLQGISGSVHLDIPPEFVKAMQLTPGGNVYLYQRGCKLIIENAEKLKRRKRSRVSMAIEL